MFTNEKDRICDAVHKDFHKPRFEAELGEVVGILQEISEFMGKLEKYMAPEDYSNPLGERAFVQREPFGLCLIIAPWNYPFRELTSNHSIQLDWYREKLSDCTLSPVSITASPSSLTSLPELVFSPLIAAIAAGNCAVIKPSEMTPHASVLMAELVPKYLDPEAFKVINGAVAETSKLLEIPFDHITYTGNSTVGKIVMAAAAKNLTPVLLELGGKSPVFVDKSANIETTASRLVFTKTFNNGQTCIAPDYVMVDASVHDKLVAAILKHIQKQYNGNVADSPDYARIVNGHHWKRLMHVIERQKAQPGSKLECGGIGKEEDKFIEPTVFTGVKFDDPIMEQEIFGPIMPIIKVDSLQQGIDFVNANEHPLAVYVFATKQKVIDFVRNNTHSGGFVANNCIAQFQNQKLPFGGVGNSGMGAYHGKWGFAAYSHAKACVEQSARKNAMDGAGPPYSPKILRLLQCVLKRAVILRGVADESFRSAGSWSS